VSPPGGCNGAGSAECVRWRRKHHEQKPELCLRVYKRDSGSASVTIKEALDVVLCWGWIDGLRTPYDAESE
jgi:uncharacterized protein YdeI (YjbR/CyaY-like superfamily)